MIKNIVLDMGNVLLSYDPYVILNKVCDTEEEKQMILTQLFESDIWLMGDRGEIKNEERYDLAKEHLPKELHQQPYSKQQLEQCQCDQFLLKYRSFLLRKIRNSEC